MSDQSFERGRFWLPDEIADEMFRRYDKAVEEGRVVDLDADDGDILPADVRCTTFSTWAELVEELRSRDRRRERNAAFLKDLEARSSPKKST